MRSKTIYLDMDGVIADFYERFFEIHDRLDLLERYQRGEFPTNYHFDNELGGEEDWWKPVREKGQVYFWESINPYDYAGNVVKLVKATGLDWYICTTPYYGNSHCVTGKINWLHKFLGPIENIIMMKDKYKLANEDSYLIDDMHHQYDRFIECGGNGFLFPQPWNDARDQVNDRLSLLKLHLDTFVQEEALVTSN